MSFELFLTYQKMVTFWTYAGESGTTLRANIEQRLAEANVTQKGLVERIPSYLVSSRAKQTSTNKQINRFQRFCAERGYVYFPANPIHI